MAAHITDLTNIADEVYRELDEPSDISLISLAFITFNTSCFLTM